MNNDERASEFEAYARAQHAWLHRQAFRMCGDWHHAEDLAQMTLHKLYEHWDTLAAHDQLAGYSRKVLLHLYLSEQRRLRWSQEVLLREGVPELAAPAEPVEDRLTLLAAMDRLGRRQRAVIMLRFWSDRSVDQTARVLDCSVGTVTSQTTRALQTLRVALGAPDGHPVRGCGGS